MQRFLDRGQTSRGRLREMDQQLLRDGRQLGVLDALPDEPPLRRLLRGELVAQERKAESAGVADQAGQEVRAAGVRHQTELAESLDEARRLGGDYEIAGECQVGARPCCDAVDRTDHGQRQRPQTQHQRFVVALDRRAEIHGRIAGSDGAVTEVLSGTEPAAGACQEQHSNRSIGLDPCENVAHFGMHRVVEAVEPVGTIERKSRDAASAGEQDVFVGHLQSLPCPPGRPKGTVRPLGGQRTPGRRPQDSQRLVPRSGMRRSRT